MRRAICAILWTILFICRASAWGPEGHVIIAMVAEDRLSPEARAAARKILLGAPLGTIGNFADEYRVTHPETQQWHFVDIPFEVPSYDETRDCAARSKGDCVIHAIERAIADIKNPKTAFFDRSDALKYLVHFVGDLHQPFHAIERKKPDGEGDKGGNDVHVKFFGDSTNLHTVWDSELIFHTGRTAEDYANFLKEQVLANMTPADWQNGSLIDWAVESHDAAKAAYVNNNDSIDQAYFDAQIKIVDKRLALAGARLAMILEQILR
jgi:S1/P1 Nuclease